VGDTSALFSQGSSVILLDAPDMSFQMTLSYLSEGLLTSFKSRSAQDRDRHDKEHESRL
jgi:hypothetical protein